MKTIKHISSIGKRERIGNKARSLKYLDKQNFRIPTTWVIPVAAWKRYQRDPERILSIIREELHNIIRPNIPFAVRSSAEKEDHSGFSYAGQFRSLLNLSNVDQVLNAVLEVWKSAEKVDGSHYDRIARQEGSTIGMGVILQKMVDAHWAGVAFSINPVTGRDEVVIEGVQGTGDQLVQEGRKPERWIYCQGGWELPEGEISPGKKVLDELLQGIIRLKQLWHHEVDVEWAYDGKALYYLQCRVINERIYPSIFSNHLSREFLPGMIKPLVWSVNIPLVNSAWIRLLEGMLGHLDIKPEQLSHSFYYRAYFNMGTMGYLFRLMGLPANSLEYLMGRKDPSGKSPFKPSIRTFRYLPRIILFLFSNLNLGRKFMRWNQQAQVKSDQLRQELAGDFNPVEFDHLFDRIMDYTKEAAYFNIMIPLVMQLANRLLNRRLEKKGLSTDLLNFYRDFPKLRDYDPHYLIRRLHHQWQGLPDETRLMISCVEDLQRMDGPEPLVQFRERFADLIKRFGHFSESGNDFSYPHWSEDADSFLE